MYFTGIADESAVDLSGQIHATKELGWRHIESRNIGGTNIHDLSKDDFDQACGELESAGIAINCFASAIGNWAKRIDEPFDSSLEEARRAIPRMKRLGTKLIRVMSFAVLDGRGPEDQMEEERFERMRTLVKMFKDEGLQPVHENCMNYGGMGWGYTLRLLENVPGLSLVFDTGNPVFSADRMKPEPCSKQSSWEFYEKVKEHISYVHVKDAKMADGEDDPVYTYPGEGDGDVKRILADLLASGYDGGISIEPHMAVVFHAEASSAESGAMHDNYVEYGRRLMNLISEIQNES